MGWYRKVPGLIVGTASMKEDERGGQGHTSINILHPSAMCHCAVDMHCFYTSAFSTLCFILSAMNGKIKQRDSIHRVLREAQ